MSNPVEIVAEALLSLWPDHVDRTESARAALDDLHEAGWRTVRTAHETVEMDDDPDSPTVGQQIERADITEEWTPGGAP